MWEVQLISCGRSNLNQLNSHQQFPPGTNKNTHQKKHLLWGDATQGSMNCPEPHLHRTVLSIPDFFSNAHGWWMIASSANITDGGTVSNGPTRGDGDVDNIRRSAEVGCWCKHVRFSTIPSDALTWPSQVTTGGLQSSFQKKTRKEVHAYLLTIPIGSMPYMDPMGLKKRLLYFVWIIQVIVSISVAVSKASSAMAPTWLLYSTVSNGSGGYSLTWGTITGDIFHCRRTTPWMFQAQILGLESENGSPLSEKKQALINGCFWFP